MASLIEDYALIGDTETAALVSLHGSIDWFCAPRFDSAPCFAALLGTPEHGRWSMGPAERTTRIERRYRGDTLVLETTFTTSTGRVTVVDFMPVRGLRMRGRGPPPGPGARRHEDRRHEDRRNEGHRLDPSVVRIVEGVSGTV